MGKKRRQTVEWNEVGQPIGKASVRFSTALGVLVRQYIQINVDYWRKVDDQKKNESWTYCWYECLFSIVAFSFCVLIPSLFMLFDAFKTLLLCLHFFLRLNAAKI